MEDVTSNIQLLANKVLLVPTISDLSNAVHDHTNDAGGGILSASCLSDPLTAISVHSTTVTATTVSTATFSGGSAEIGTGSHGMQINSSVSDNFNLFTYTNTPNPNWSIGYGNGSGSPDASKEYITSNAGHISFMNSNVGIGTTGEFGGGAKVIGIANAATAPSSNPTGGGVLYAEAGALKWRGSSGTVTTIASA